MNFPAPKKLNIYYRKLFIYLIAFVFAFHFFPFPSFLSIAKETSKNTVKQSKIGKTDSAKKSSFLIKVKDPLAKQKVLNKLQIKDTNPLKKRKTKSDKKSIEGEKWIRVETSEDNLSKIKSDPDVELIQKNIKRSVTAIQPNDTDYVATQWNMEKISLGSSTLGGWELETGSTSTPIIAVIDTGLDFNHPDITDNVWRNPGENGTTSSEGPVPNCTSRGLTLDKSCNNIDDDLNGFIDDFNGFNFADSCDGGYPYCSGDGRFDDLSTDIINNNVMDTDAAGHGTHVSGIIAARGNNSKGVAGSCWTCKIMPLKVINSLGYGYDSDIALAIEYATNNGAKVINMSLGGEGYSQVLQDAVDYASSHDVLVVSASGNASGSASDSYPSGLNNTLSVGATDSSDIVTDFSNDGEKLDLTAPGVSINSAQLCSTTQAGCGSSGTYHYLTGTSMASPHVAGVAALIRSLHPSWTQFDTRNALLNNTDDKGNSGFDNSFGFGRLNGLKALQSSALAPDVINPIGVLNDMPGFINGNYPVKGSASDSNLYIYTITLVDNSNENVLKQVSGRNNVINNTLTSIDTTTFPDGEYKIYMRVEDFAGNISNSVVKTFGIDNTLPENFNISVSKNNEKATFNFSTTDNYSGINRYEISLDNGTYTPATNGSTFSFVDGNHTATVRAVDNAGNIISSTINFTTFNRPAYLKTKGDFSSDGNVDLTDLSILAQNFGRNTSSGDINNDGIVDLTDLSVLAQNFLKSF